MPQIELRFLGAPFVTRDDQPVATDRRKAVAILAYLALADGPVTRENLATLFWPDYDAASAHAYLRRTLWEIKQMVGEGVLSADRQQVALRQSAAVWVDVAAFQGLLAGSSTQPEIAALNAAVALYRDDFLAGFSLSDAPEFDDWQRFHTQRLRDALGSAFQRLAAACEAEGNLAAALPYAVRWLHLDRFHEPAHRLVMRLLARSDQRAAALRQYESCRALLREELGAEPEPETTTLYHRIRAGELAGGKEAKESSPAPPLPYPAAPPAATATRAALHSPGAAWVSSTPLLGREQELAALTALITQSDCRLLTMVGPGGVGKTRLALALAAQFMQPEDQARTDGARPFPDGVYFIPLASLTTSAELATAIAQGMGFSFHGVELPDHQLENYLRRRRVLLVLDNYEHLLNTEGQERDATASTSLLRLLTTAGEARLLVTSRQPLRLAYERLYPIEGLAVPSAQQRGTVSPPLPSLAPNAQPLGAGSGSSSQAENYSAVQLFVQAARQRLPAFTLTPTYLPAVIAICRMVGGLPLAIELAAGWVSVLSPPEIQREIAAGLDILASDLIDLPERQRSMRAVFDSTWKQLSPVEQHTLMALALFHGSFSREAAQQVSGAGLSTLLTLTHKALLRRRGDEPWLGDGSATLPQFELHELLRQYSAERLAADIETYQNARSRYVDYYLTLLRKHGAEFSGPRQMQAMDQVTLVWEHVQQAWLWALADGRFAEVGALFPALHIYLLARHIRPAIRTLAASALRLIDAESQDTEERLVYLQFLILLAWADVFVLTSPLAEESARRARTLAAAWGLEERLGGMMVTLTMIYAIRCDSETAITMMGASLARIRASGRCADLAWALNVDSEFRIERQDYAGARQALEESIAIARRLEDALLLAADLLTLGALEARLQNEEAAQALLAESQQWFASVGDRSAVAEVFYQMGISHQRLGAYTEGIRLLLAGQQIVADLGDERRAADMISWASITARDAGDYPLAWQLRERAEGIYRRLGDEHGIAWSAWESGELCLRQGRLAEARAFIQQALAMFERYALIRGVSYCRRSLGEAAQAAGDLAEAAAHYQISLRLSEEEAYGWGISFAHIRLGQAALQMGRVAEAEWHLQQGLAEAARWPDRALCLMALTTLAAAALTRGETEAAAVITCFVSEHPATWPETRQQVHELSERLLAVSTPAERAAAQQEAHALTLPRLLERVRHSRSPQGENATA